jgi:hypothetical protein
LLPVINSNSVVLPEPFGPITPTTDACSTLKSASREKVTCGLSKPRL